MERQDAIEELALIRRVIDESRRFTFDNGRYYLMWGVLVAVAIFVQYGAILARTEWISAWIWIVTIGVGWLASILMGMREKSSPGAWPVGAKLIALIWASSGISMTIIGFVAPSTGALQPWAICPAIATVMGGAYAISSLVYRLRWVTMIGIAWWVGALVMFIVKGITTLPIFGAMMILFQVVPGLVFYRNSKRNAAGENAQ